MPKVFYTWEQAQQSIYDSKFKRQIQWDIPLLEGYDYTFVKNTAPKPGAHHFRGIVNPTLTSEISDWQPDAVLCFGWSYYGHLQAIRYFKGKIPVLFRGDSHLLNEKAGLRQWLRRRLLKWVYRHIDRALYVGTNNRNYYLKHGVKPDELTLAPHAIDNDRFSQDEELHRCEARRWRQTLGIQDQDLVFLFAGKFESKKNPILLLDAFLAIRLSRSHLIFVGNGVLAEELKAKAAGNANVHFLDFQNQSRMPVAYRLANVFVLPSRGPGETWGLAVNEAMACGLPVLVSDKVGCAVDLVEDGVNGYTFLSENQPDLEAKMKAVIAGPEQLTLMGEQSYQIIQQWSFKALCTGVEKAMLDQMI